MKGRNSASHAVRPPKLRTVSLFNGKLHVGLLFLDDVIAPDAMGAYLKYSVLLQTRSENSGDVLDALRGGRTGVFGQSKGIPKDERGEWKNEFWADMCSGVVLIYNFRGRGRAPGFPGDAMEWRVELIIDSWGMIDCRANRFSLICSGV